MSLPFWPRAYCSRCKVRCFSTLVEADLKGIHSHGILRLKRYVRRLRTRVTNPTPHADVSDEGPAIARVDGDGALGPLVGSIAMQTCIEKARQAGSASALFRSRHFGTAGYYALMAQDADLSGISMTVADPSRLARPGGTQPLFGNNPLALAVPGDQTFPC